MTYASEADDNAGVAGWAVGGDGGDVVVPYSVPCCGCHAGGVVSSLCAGDTARGGVDGGEKTAVGNLSSMDKLLDCDKLTYLRL